MPNLTNSTPVDDFLQAATKAAMRTALELGNVNNTSDANKPISSAQQTALDAKASTGAVNAVANALIAHADDTGNPHEVTKTQVGLGNVADVNQQNADNLTSGSIPTGRFANATVPFAAVVITGTPNGSKFVRDDGSFQTIPGGGDALTSNPLSQFASTTSAQLRTVLSDETGTGPAVFGTSPNITTPTGIVKGDVGLGNVDNTSDAAKPVSTAQQTALDLKAPLASPTFTGTPAGPTAAPGTNTTQLSTTAFVQAAVSLAVTGLLDFKGSLDASANPNYPAASKGDSYFISVAGKVGGASGKSVEIGDLIVANADNAGGTEASVGTSWFTLEHNLVGALVASNNLSDVALPATARTNLGLGNVDNTSDAAKPVSSAQQTALDLKAPKTAIGLQISLGLACSDMTTAITAGTNKGYFPAPFDGTLDEVFFTTNTAPTGGTQIFDVNKNGTTMLSIKVTIDAGETSSLSAATQPVISVTTFSKGDFISVDFDQVGATIAGLGIVAMFKLTRTA